MEDTKKRPRRWDLRGLDDSPSSSLLLQNRQRRLGLIGGQVHVAGFASSFRFLHQRSSLRHVSPRCLGRSGGASARPRRLHVLVTARSLDVLVAARRLDVLVTARRLHVLVATRGLDVLVAARGLHILITARGLDILASTSQGPGRLHVLVATRSLGVLVAARGLRGLVLARAS